MSLGEKTKREEQLWNLYLNYMDKKEEKPNLLYLEYLQSKSLKT
jgi:hypothetical protein